MSGLRNDNATDDRTTNLRRSSNLMLVPVSRKGLDFGPWTLDL